MTVAKEEQIAEKCEMPAEIPDNKDDISESQAPATPEEQIVPNAEKTIISDNIPPQKAPVKKLTASLTAERYVLVVDEEGQRRLETVEIVKQILPNAEIETADAPEIAEVKMSSHDYDTYVVNFLMPGYSSSNFVKTICNHPKSPLLVGFAADKMSDAYDPKKGIKIKPLSRLFEIESIFGTPVDTDNDTDD